MDYKYINQLLDRYWEAETSLEEEQILRTFFSQSELPAEFEKYRELFCFQNEQREASLDESFDERIMQLIDAEAPVVVKARKVSMADWLRPIGKAAAVVAVVLALGQAAQAPWDNSWSAPQGGYSAYGEAQSDSGLAVQPMQAENIVDSTAAKPAEAMLLQ